MQAVSVLVYEEALAWDSELPDIHRYHVEVFNALIGAMPAESEWLDEDEDEEEGVEATILDMAAHVEMVNRMMT